MLGILVLVALLASAAAAAAQTKPNILVIMGDDIGYWNVGYNNRGMMGYATPHIDRIAHEGLSFTDYYAQQSCTAGRAAFITGQAPIRTGLTKVGIPGASVGLQPEDPTLAELLGPHGYATGQFGKNHLGDRNEFLPTVHGFDEFFGNLYHLNAEEEPEHEDYPKNPQCRARSGPQGSPGSRGSTRPACTSTPTCARSIAPPGASTPTAWSSTTATWARYSPSHSAFVGRLLAHHARRAETVPGVAS
jgi:arylsulfatase